MDYRFTMTNRLIALAVISFLLLLSLLFALGFQLGQQWGAEEAKTQHRIAQQAQPYTRAGFGPDHPERIALNCACSLHAGDNGYPALSDFIC
jgi:hypothetical protein